MARVGERISYRLLSAVCEGGHEHAPRDFTAARGVCRRCGSGRFDAVVEREVAYVEKSVGAADVAAELLFDANLPKHRLQRTPIELRKLNGRELILALAKPPAEAGAWIQEARRAGALATLRPDQKVCATCGTIFAPPKYGPAADGFCSPRCRGERKPVPAAAGSGEPIDAACPHCGKVLRLRASAAGKPVACPACNRRFEAPKAWSVPGQPWLFAAAQACLRRSKLPSACASLFR